MTVYYRGPSALITEEFVQVRTPEERTFRIADLNSVYVVCGSRRRRLPTCLFPAATVSFAAMMPMVAAPAGLFVAVAAVAVATIALTACVRAPAPPYELRAWHQGQSIQVFQSADALVFGQVKRALMRALQQRPLW